MTLNELLDDIGTPDKIFIGIILSLLLFVICTIIWDWFFNPVWKKEEDQEVNNNTWIQK